VADANQPGYRIDLSRTLGFHELWLNWFHYQTSHRLELYPCKAVIQDMRTMSRVQRSLCWAREDAALCPLLGRRVKSDGSECFDKAYLWPLLLPGMLIH
jgi:hypothetical protein